MARGKRTDKQELDREDRRQDVLLLRRNGLSIRAIAAKVGISPVTVLADLRAGLQAVIEETKDRAEENRAIDLERIDAAVELAMREIESGNIDAIDKLVKLLDRRAKLLGIDAPTKTDVTSDGEKIQPVIWDWRSGDDKRSDSE